MLTYVINTSENKTFDCDTLFKLSGYNKICWMYCRLDNVSTCTRDICARQNVLGAEPFRIVVLVDFYGFDRLRKPYGCGERGYDDDSGVDLCLYYPFIEVFLTDNLFNELKKHNLSPASNEVYYIQNESSDRIFNNISDRRRQLRKMFFPDTDEVCSDGEREAAEPADGVNDVALVQLNNNTDSPMQPELDEDAAAQHPHDTDTRYAKFYLHCTPDISLPFAVSEYPYGVCRRPDERDPAFDLPDVDVDVDVDDDDPLCEEPEEQNKKLSFKEFVDGFDSRVSSNLKIPRYLYKAEYGRGETMAAFDTLALSLYLVRIYEREEVQRPPTEEQQIEVIEHLDPHAVREVLQRAWNKIHRAQQLASETRSDEYYSLDIDGADSTMEKLVTNDDLSEQQFIIPDSDLKGDCEELFEQIRFISSGGDAASEEDRIEIDNVIKEYLKERDKLRHSTVQDEFAQLISNGRAAKQPQCPSKPDRDMAVEKRHGWISTLFRRTLKAEYLSTDYDEIYERASKSYARFLELDRKRSKCIVADVIMLLLTIAAMVVPYICLQQINSDTMTKLLYATLVAAPFAGLFFVIFLVTVLIISARISRVREELRQCLRECKQKHEYTLSALKRRYEDDLPLIERLRYEIRGIDLLYESNLEQLRNISYHRKTLEEVENLLSAMLNNLGVQPVPDSEETLSEEEFDMTKPVRSPKNTVYRVFSIEAIEAMFPSKEGSGK